MTVPKLGCYQPRSRRDLPELLLSLEQDSVGSTLSSDVIYARGNISTYQGIMIRSVDFSLLLSIPQLCRRCPACRKEHVPI